MQYKAVNACVNQMGLPKSKKTIKSETENRSLENWVAKEIVVTLKRYFCCFKLGCHMLLMYAFISMHCIIFFFCASNIQCYCFDIT